MLRVGLNDDRKLQFDDERRFESIDGIHGRAYDGPATRSTLFSLPGLDLPHEPVTVSGRVVLEKTGGPVVVPFSISLQPRYRSERRYRLLEFLRGG